MEYAADVMMPLIALFFVAVSAPAQTAPAAAAPVAAVTGRGVQIYACGGEDKWVFVAPEAVLLRDGAEVGTHGAGPLWQWKDGSAVTGKVVTTTPAEDPARNIPSLELAATSAGSDGVLAPVTRVSRTETEGGVAPAGGCDAAHRGNTLRVPYTATYRFWVR